MKYLYCIILFLVLTTLSYKKAFSALPPDAHSPICEVKSKVISINSKSNYQTFNLEIIDTYYANGGYYEGINKCEDVFKKGETLKVNVYEDLATGINQVGAIIQFPVQKQSEQGSSNMYYKNSAFSNYPDTHQIIQQPTSINSTWWQNILDIIMNIFSN